MLSTSAPGWGLSKLDSLPQPQAHSCPYQVLGMYRKMRKALSSRGEVRVHKLPWGFWGNSDLGVLGMAQDCALVNSSQIIWVPGPGTTSEWFQNGGPQPAAAARTCRLDRHTLRPHPDLPTQSSGAGPSDLHFNESTPHHLAIPMQADH